MGVLVVEVVGSRIVVCSVGWGCFESSRKSSPGALCWDKGIKDGDVVQKQVEKVVMFTERRPGRACVKFEIWNAFLSGMCLFFWSWNQHMPWPSRTFKCLRPLLSSAVMLQQGSTESTLLGITRDSKLVSYRLLHHTGMSWCKTFQYFVAIVPETHLGGFRFLLSIRPKNIPSYSLPAVYPTNRCFVPVAFEFGMDHFLVIQ